ncbi:MAG: amidohydrolase [Ruminococcaceae bacterium]|nr:amidohydrolase [Oscillospiraceae bacterium]
MKLIDFHTHVFSEKIAERTIAMLSERSGAIPYTNGTAEGLLEAMKRADATLAVALPVLTKPSQFEGVNRFAADLNQRLAEGTPSILSFGGIHPACEELTNKMEQLKDMGFLGVKIHPDYQGAYVDCDGYVEILTAARELDMIVVTHGGVDDGFPDQPVRCTPERLRRLIALAPHSKLVVAHYGGNRQALEVMEQLAGEDVYFDTSYSVHGMDPDLFRAILRKHGADRVLFASDCPWREIAEEAEIIRSFGLSREEEEKIFYRNAEALLGMEI